MLEVLHLQHHQMALMGCVHRVTIVLKQQQHLSLVLKAKCDLSLEVHHSLIVLHVLLDTSASLVILCRFLVMLANIVLQMPLQNSVQSAAIRQLLVQRTAQFVHHALLDGFAQLLDNPVTQRLPVLLAVSVLKDHPNLLHVHSVAIVQLLVQCNGQIVLYVLVASTVRMALLLLYRVLPAIIVRMDQEYLQIVLLVITVHRTQPHQFPVQAALIALFAAIKLHHARQDHTVHHNQQGPSCVLLVRCSSTQPRMCHRRRFVSLVHRAHMVPIFFVWSVLHVQLVMFVLAVQAVRPLSMKPLMVDTFVLLVTIVQQALTHQHRVPLPHMALRQVSKMLANVQHVQRTHSSIKLAKHLAGLVAAALIHYQGLVNVFVTAQTAHSS